MRSFYLKIILLGLLTFTIPFEATASPGTYTISGRIIEEKTNTPVPGASVVIKGTYLWAVSYQKGEFTMPGVQNGKYNLEVSFLGYVPTTVPVDVRSNIQNLTIQLKENTFALDDVVVTAQAPKFVPEMQRKCLKLTLYLPYPELKMTGNMLFSGLLLLLVCFASNFLLMEVYLNGILAHELKNHILLTALTWYLAGISGYLLIAWICLEPAWKRRILNLVIAVLLLRIFFLSPTPEAYNKFLPYLLIYTLLTASFSWLSIVRFKAGKQD